MQRKLFIDSSIGRYKVSCRLEWIRYFTDDHHGLLNLLPLIYDKIFKVQTKKGKLVFLHEGVFEHHPNTKFKKI